MGLNAHRKRMKEGMGNGSRKNSKGLYFITKTIFFLSDSINVQCLLRYTFLQEYFVFPYQGDTRTKPSQTHRVDSLRLHGYPTDLLNSPASGQPEPQVIVQFNAMFLYVSVINPQYR